MGLLELILLIVIISAVLGRGRLGLGMVLDVLIAILIIGLLYRIILLVL